MWGKKKAEKEKPIFHQGITHCAICNEPLWEPTAGVTTSGQIVHFRCHAVARIGFTEGELERGWFYDPENNNEPIRLEKWYRDQWDKKLGEGLRYVFAPLTST